MRPQGVIVPLLTPFNDDGEVDYSATRRLIDHVINGGVDGIFVAGTTGEFTRLSEYQRHALFNEVTEYVSGRVPVYAGVSDTNRPQVLRHIKAASKSGVDGLVLSLPFYFPLTDPGEINNWFTGILSETADLPWLAYNIPGNVGASIPPEIIGEIKPLLHGFKDSGPDATGMRAYIEALGGKGRTVSYLCGNEALFAEGLSMEVDGLVPSLANVFPELLAAIWDNRANLAIAQKYIDIMVWINAWNRRYPSSLGLIMWKKKALSLMGIMSANMSWPTKPAPSQDDELLRKLLDEVQVKLAEVKAEKKHIG